MTAPEPLHPERAAHASIRGYLYQTCLGVLRWLELGPREVLVCEGNEDLDRLFGGSDVYEQAKAYTDPIGFTSPVVTESLGNFARDYVILRQQDRQPRFVFTTTAPRKTPRSGPDLLEAWGDPSRQAEVAAAVRGRLAASDLEGLAEARDWFDADSVRWEAFVRAVEWSFGEGFEGIHGKIQSLLAARKDTRRLPAEIFADRLAVAVLEASSRKDVQERVLTREDLEMLAKTSREELEDWAESADARRFRSTFEEAKQLDSLLFANTRDLPPNAGPGKLLSAAYEVIPFDDAGRREELEMLESWCNAEDRRSVRLLTGEGGSGKTRLMIEWCKRLREQGWHAGFFRPDRGTGDLEPLLEGVRPRLVVLDYAETKLGIVELLLLKMALAPKDSGPKLRLLLLARRSGDWWTGLARQGEAVEDFLLRSPEPRTISPLVPDPEDRPQVFEAARQAFAAHLRPSLPGRGQAGSGGGQAGGSLLDLSGKDYHRALYIHMAALLAALDEEASGTRDALKRVLDHERIFWSNQALELRLDSSLTDLVRQAIEPVMAGLTLAGGAGDLAQGHALLDRVLRPFPLRPDLPGTLLRLLHRLYGGSADQGGRYLDPLQPDLLGEQLVNEYLEKDTDLLSRLLDGAGREEQYSTLTVLTRLARDRKDPHWLQVVLRGNLEALAEIALDVAVTTGDPIGAELSKVVEEEGSIDLMAMLEAHCADEKYTESVPLREVAATVTTRLLNSFREQWRAPTEEQLAELARLALNSSTRLGNLGRPEHALQAAQEAAELYNSLAEHRPDTFLSGLALSLNNLGVRFINLGRSDDALKEIQRSIDLYRELAQQQPEVFLPNLATSLTNLSINLTDLGRHAEAFQAAQEAADLYRALTQHQPDSFLPGLANSLSNLGPSLSNLGRREDALQVAQESISIYRWLAQDRPDAFLHTLATGLSNLGMSLSDLGRHEEALQVTQEAVEIRRQLAQQRPDAFLFDLSLSLNNLGLWLKQLGRREEALRSLQEACEIFRTLAQQQPGAYLSYLATGLGNLGNSLATLGKDQEALQATREDVEICRILAQQQPDAFLPALAGSLNNLGLRFSSLKQHEEALEATQKATDLYESLAQQRPQYFLPRLATCLSNLGLRLNDLGRYEEALKATTRAVDLCRALTQEQPDAFLPDLARSLNNLGMNLSSLGRHDDAILAIKEAAELYRTLAQQRPRAFLSDLAATLFNLGNVLRAMGQHENALRATQRAVNIQRQLAQELPDAFLPDLAKSLNNLGNRLSDLGRHEDARHSAQEAVDSYRTLAQQQPDAFLPNLAMGLYNLSNRLRELGRSEDALHAAQEAVDSYRSLAQQRPDSFLPNLASSLHKLSLGLGDLEKQEDALFAIEEAVQILTPFFQRYPEALRPRMLLTARQYLTCAQAANREPDPELLRPIKDLLKESEP